MTSKLAGVLPRLRDGLPVDPAALDEIERVLAALQGEGWSGFITADEALAAIVKDGRTQRAEARGLGFSDAKFKRKYERVTAELGSHIAKAGAMRHEIKKLEDLLAWIHRTEQPIEEIRAVIEKTIPRRLAREESAEA